MADSTGKSLWGGRCEGSVDETFEEFNRSFRVDSRLFGSDLKASLAHCEALRRVGVLTDSEASQLEGALRTMLSSVAEGDAVFGDFEAEDVHSFIEGKLIEMVGEVGRKIHTGRSRNDQVATAFRIWMREAVRDLESLIGALQGELLDIATRHPDAVIPGYTHLQPAQPVLFAHWCLAYFEMLRRDRERLGDARARIDVMPLGSGALAGSGFPVDRNETAKELGFRSVTRNSLDGVSDRDFAVETVGALSILMMHLSRLAEDLIVYSSREFGLVELGDAVSTGSSLMPQKKNPDALELIRGKAARVFGHHAALLALMKGLPLSYNKDMQEDKQAVFDAFDTAVETVRVTAVVLRNVFLREERAAVSSSVGYLNATELADYLVRKGMPFRTAHEMVGALVKSCIDRGCELSDLSLDELKEFSELIEDDVFGALSVESALKSKSVVGGTSPERVSEALAEARRYLETEG